MLADICRLILFLNAKINNTIDLQVVYLMKIVIYHHENFVKLYVLF